MGMGQDQINKTLEALANMDEAQLEKTLQAAQMFQAYTAPIQDAWNKVNGLCCGQLRNVLILLVVLSMAYLFVFLYLFMTSSSPGVSPAVPLASNVDVGGGADDVPVMDEQDEFSEF